MTDEQLLDEDEFLPDEPEAIADELCQFTVEEYDAGMRADLFLVQQLPQYSRTFLQQAFRDNGVLADGEPLKKNSPLEAGMNITFTVPESKDRTLRAVAIPLDIVYEDEHIVAVNKPVGMVTHPGAGTGDDTLVHALLHHTGNKLCKLSGAERPGVVHRLDKETSGVMVFAKSEDAYHSLIAQFKARTLEKQYLALVQYAPALDSGTIHEPIGRDEQSRVKMTIHPDGRDAHTDWTVELRRQHYALLRCWIHSGRTHQIRVHMSHIGHPLLGDTVYGFRINEWQGKRPPRVMLHASRLYLDHPETGERLKLHAKVPDDFIPYLKDVN